MASVAALAHSPTTPPSVGALPQQHAAESETSKSGAPPTATTTPQDALTTFANADKTLVQSKEKSTPEKVLKSTNSRTYIDSDLIFYFSFFSHFSTFISVGA